MVKDRKARQRIDLTVIAIANLIAAVTDAMRNADLGNDVVHRFLDELDHLNWMTIHGPPQRVLNDIIEVVRGTVPVND